jgi:hypothetical protein
MPVQVDVKPSVSATRSCGPCTACCYGWLVANIRGYDMKPGTPCHFVGDRGCTIYEERPSEPCRRFFCAWAWLPSPFPDSFRPDRIGVIIVERTWRNRPAYRVASAGREVDETLFQWIVDFHKRTSIPFIFPRNGKLSGIGPPEFRQDVIEREARGDTPLD